MIVGISMMTMAANSPPQLEVYIMESFNAYIPREIVRKFCLEANTSASIYSFQMLTKLNTEMQINPGCTNGSIMRANMRNSPHPSMIADSSNSLGSVRKKPVSTNKLKGKYSAV